MKLAVSNTSVTTTTTTCYDYNEYLDFKEIISVCNGVEDRSCSLVFKPEHVRLKDRIGNPCLIPSHKMGLVAANYDNIYDALTRNPTTEEVTDESNYVIFHYHSGMLLFDSQLTPIPVARSFDYIGTPFSSKHATNLDDMYKYLSNHPMVLNVQKMGRIPYYNNKSGRDEYLKVTILPTQDVWTEVYDKYKNAEFYSVSMWNAVSGQISDSDYLGLQPFLRKDSYYRVR